LSPFIKIFISGWVSVAYTCNPSYSGGKDWRITVPSQLVQIVRPYLEKTHHQKRAGGVAQGAGPEFKPQYHKNK
jgi:hypothetical protein